MDKPHKLHHKPSAGSKAAKKDVAKGVDRTGGKSYNPKVRVFIPFGLKELFGLGYRLEIGG